MNRSVGMLRKVIVVGVLCVVPSGIKAETPEKAEFVGSSPCELMTEDFLGIVTTNSPHDKITWALTLFTNQQGLPTTYQLIATHGMQAQSAPGFAEGAETIESAGSWEILKGTKSNPGAVVFRIKSEKTNKSLSFVRVSHNVLHLLNQDGNLMTGDDLWSYTLNRKGAGRDD